MTVRELLHLGRTPVAVNRGSNPIVAFQDEVNKLFNEFFGELSFPSWSRATAPALTLAPAVDVSETDKEFKITAELPGLNAKEIQVTTADGYVTIKGEKKEEKKEEKEGYYRQERSYGSFQRVVALPDTANFEKAEASFKNGVLTLTLPKQAGAQAKERKVDVKEAA
ncbi:MAG TPA: Hsp20/alpha crystallin family protein [Rickettsiales bacterium]|nr:Hsp20/alpha crystallin family protein [Rickettsiales bacterium]